jgi:hypothetical protein
MFNVQHEFTLLAHAARVMAGVCKQSGCDTAVIEYQAPMGVQHTCRWNAYVEGALATSLCILGLNVMTGHPSAIKTKLGLATGNYTNNKRMAFLYASEQCQDITSHHEADCFILAKWFQNEFVSVS